MDAEVPEAISPKHSSLSHQPIVRKQVLSVVEWLSELSHSSFYLLATFLPYFLTARPKHWVHRVLDVEVVLSVLAVSAELGC